MDSFEVRRKVASTYKQRLCISILRYRVIKSFADINSKRANIANVRRIRNSNLSEKYCLRCFNVSIKKIHIQSNVIIFISIT